MALRFVCFLIFIGWGTVISSAFGQTISSKWLENGKTYAVAGVFESMINAEKLLQKALLDFPKSFLAQHPESGLTYVILSGGAQEDNIHKIAQYRSVSGFEKVWLFTYASEPRLSIMEGSKPSQESNRPPSSGLKLSPAKRPNDEASKVPVDQLVDTVDVFAVRLPDSTNKALELLMRSASVTTEERIVELKLQVAGDTTPPQPDLSVDGSTGDEMQVFNAFDMELPRIQNNIYTSVKETYEEEFTLLVRPPGKQEGEYLDIELLDGHQQVRFIRLAPNQVHQVRIPKDAMRDLVLRGVVDGRYTFSLGLDLLVLFYSKELNSKLIDVTERNLIIFPPSDFLDTSSPRYVFYFQNGSSIFERSCHYELNELVRFLKEHPERGVSVTGYTNAGGMGRAWKNIHDEFFKISDLTIKQDALAIDLALDRAMSVQRYLIKQGIAPVRIQVQANTSRKLFRSNLFEGRYNARAEVFID